MLQISAIEKQFGSLQVLKKVDIHARKGEFLALLGPSGCGKSTLLSIIAGLAEPSAGEILIDGEVVTDREPKDRDIAMVFQSYALYPSMTVAENITFGMRVRKVPKAVQEQALASVAKVLKLEPMLDRKPSQLSGGQRQRVAMGRALVRHPKIFLFDEPLSNLDAQLRVEMRTELKRLHGQLNATIVYVTHDQVEAMTLATQIVVMNGGVAQQIGAPQEIYDRPANTFVAKFIGSPAMNLIPGKLEVSNGKLAVRVRDSHEHEPFITTIDTRSSTAEQGQDVLLGIRPEAIQQDQATDWISSNVISLEIDMVEPLGSDTVAFLKLNGHELIARLRPNSCPVGSRPNLYLPPEKLLVYSAKTGELVS